MCWYVLACLCLHFCVLGHAGRGGVVSPACVVLILALKQRREREMQSIQAALNLINSCFKLTGEINCRMKHKQKPPKKRTNEQITMSDWWRGGVNWLLAPTSNFSLFTCNSTSRQKWSRASSCTGKLSAPLQKSCVCLIKIGKKLLLQKLFFGCSTLEQEKGVFVLCEDKDKQHHSRSQWWTGAASMKVSHFRRVQTLVMWNPMLKHV